MRIAERFVRLLIALALAFAAPAWSVAPAKASVAIELHTETAGHGASSSVARAARHDCDHDLAGSKTHIAAADCLICCWALNDVPAASEKARGARRLAPADRAAALTGLNRAPPAPPPRA